MIYIYGIPVYTKEKANITDSNEDLNENNILSAFKAVTSKQEVRNEFENLLYAEVQKNPDLLTGFEEYISKAWINSCLECMPGEIAQRINQDKDVLDLVMNDLTMPIVEKIKKSSPQPKRKKLFRSFAKVHYAMVDRMFDRAIFGAAMFNAAILDEAMNIELRTDPKEALTKLWKE